MQDAYDKAAVLAGHGTNPAIVAIQAAQPDALLDAKFDRGELTLKIAREHIRAGRQPWYRSRAITSSKT